MVCVSAMSLQKNESSNFKILKYSTILRNEIGKHFQLKKIQLGLHSDASGGTQDNQFLMTKPRLEVQSLL